jgi:hypothetical protein
MDGCWVMAVDKSTNFSTFSLTLKKSNSHEMVSGSFDL